MRRLAFLLILLLLIPSISQARTRGIFKTVASGTVTKANMRLSGVDGGATASGGAFVDFGYKYQSDFSAGESGFTAYQGAVAGNIDSIGGEDNTLRFTCNNTSNQHQLQRATTYTVGKKYTVTFRYYIPSGNSNVDQLFLIPGNWGGGTAQVLSTLDTWTTVTKTFTALYPTLAIAAADGGVAVFQDAGGDDVFYIKDIKVEENPLPSYIGHLLKITDSAGKSIMGYIKAAGTGETSTLLTADDSSTFTSSVGSWVAERSGTITASGGKGVLTPTTESYSGMKINKLYPLGGLYYGSLKHRLQSGTAQVLEIRGPGLIGSAINKFTPTSSETTFTFPFQTSVESQIIRVVANETANGAVYEIDDVLLYQVLTPSATGVTIVSSKGGATYNWFNKDSAFNWNDASGYTYQIIKENRTTLIATSNVSAGNALMDTTTDNAFAAPVGVDLSPYQDGRHLAHFTDSSGYVAVGWISATAPSGEALGSELTPNNTAVSDSQTEGNATTGWTTVGYVPTTFESTSSGTPSTGTYHFHIVADASGKGFYLLSSGTQGAIYKLVFDIKVTSGTVLVDTYNGELSIPYTNASYETKTIYYNSFNSSGHYADIWIRSYSGGAEWYNDNMQLARLNMPAATGALLLSSKGGSRGYLYKSASFDANKALTLKILFMGD